MLFQFWALANVAFDPAQRCVDITKLRRKFGARRTHLRTAVFLDLVELTNGETANEIYKALISCLNRHVFDMNYLKEYFDRWGQCLKR